MPSAMVMTTQYLEEGNNYLREDDGYFTDQFL
jgi:hypothetical protein